MPYFICPYTINIVIFRILDVVAGLANPLQEQNKDGNSVCCFRMNVPPPSTDAAIDTYSKFLESEFLADLTLLVGPDKVPIRVHKLVLAAHFQYFKSMFSSGLMESTSSEVHLPFVGPEDLNLILKYAYCGEVNLSKDNVFKIAVMANYFGCDVLMDKCCNFIKKFTNLQNFGQLVDMACHLDMNQLRKNCVLFTVDHLQNVNKDDLSSLPVDVLLGIAQHPATVIMTGFAENEKHMFHVLCDRVK